MGSVQVVSDIDAPLKDFFADAPAGVKPILRRGFSVLGGLDQTQITALADLLKASVDRSGDLDVQELSAKLGLDKEAANGLTSASSLLIALTISREEEPEAVVSELISSGLTASDAERAITLLLRLLHSDRESIKHVSDLNELATEILPAFRSLETSLDLRLRFNADKVDLVVPVIVASLKTDMSRNNTFFQLKKSDVIRLAEQFQKLKNELEMAEKWMQAGR